MRTYTGRIEAGCFLTLDGSPVPDCPVAVLVVEGGTQDESQKQAEAMRRFRAQIRNCAEPVPEFERVKLREVDV